MRKVLQLPFSKNIRNVFSKVSAMPLSVLGNVNSDRNILSAQFYTKRRGVRESLIWFFNLSWVSQYLLKRKTDFKKPTFSRERVLFQKLIQYFENIELRKNPLAKVQTATFLLRFWCNFISFNLLICKDLRISGARRVTRESGGRASKEKCPQGPISVTRNLISSVNRNSISASKSWQMYA